MIKSEGVENIHAVLEAREKELAALRDKLSEDIERYTDILDSCDRALDHLNVARDALSEFV